MPEPKKKAPSKKKMAKSTSLKNTSKPLVKKAKPVPQSRKKQATSAVKSTKKSSTKKPKIANKKSKAKKSNRKKRFKSNTVIRNFLFFCGKLILVLSVVLACYGVYLNVKIQDKLSGRTFAIPAVVYAKALDLYEGKTLSAEQLQWHLTALGYRQTSQVDQPGEYQRSQNKFDIFVRDFDHWDQPLRAKRILITLGEQSIHRLTDRQGQGLILHKLEPQSIGELYANNQKRQLIQLEQVPLTMLEGLIAVEDRQFYQHFGLSPIGILRAAWANLLQGKTVQGGSTLTQQLVKNLFLYNKRSWWRKFNEALMSVLVEAQFSKQQILQAYVNEVYYTQQSGKAVHGFALASRYFFATDIEHLQLHQQALLIAMIKGPYYYHPVNQPKRAMARRNLVLEVMRNQAIIDETQFQSAINQPLSVAIAHRTSRPTDFLELVKQQVDQDYHAEDLASQGIKVFSSFEPFVHFVATKKLQQRLKKIATSKQLAPDTIQAAVVITDTDNANVRTIIGSNAQSALGFNRALHSKRQIGSLIKPFIYTQALATGDYHLATPLKDKPISIRLANGDDWRPQNYDQQSHGTPALITALAKSYNLATVYLSQQLGVASTVKFLQRFGLKDITNQQPSLALGAIELSAYQVANLYQVFANNGFYTRLNAVEAVVNEKNQLLERHHPKMQQVVDVQTMYLMQHALTHTMRQGTGRWAYQVLDQQLSIAGKTGTSNQSRDSWFVGYADNSLVSVWLGADDNRPLPITGSTGALRVWTDIFSALPLTPQRQSQPMNITWEWVDSDTLQRTKAFCPGAIKLPFIGDNKPVAFKRCQF